MDLDYNTMFRLDGRTAIVTGGAGGMGFEMARGLAAQGSAVVLADLNADGLREAEERLRAEGAVVTSVALDVTADDSPGRLLETAESLGGRADILVNNAGILSNVEFGEMDDAQWDKMMSVNLHAAMRMMRAALVDMKAKGGGNIINMGSSWSSRASVFNQSGGGPDYCASKAAVQALTRSAAYDGAEAGVRVNAIGPGIVDTTMHAHHRDFLYQYEKFIPVGRMQLAHDVVGTAIFLASPASFYITGQTIHVNGGMVMVD